MSRLALLAATAIAITGCSTHPAGTKGPNICVPGTRYRPEREADRCSGCGAHIQRVPHGVLR